MKLLPLTLVLVTAVALCSAYGDYGRQNRANEWMNNGDRSNRRPGGAIQPASASKTIEQEEMERKNCKMMHKSAAQKRDAPSQNDVEFQNQQWAGNRFGYNNNGRKPKKYQGEANADVGGFPDGDRRRNDNYDGRGGANDAAQGISDVEQQNGNGYRQGGRRRQRPGGGPQKKKPNGIFNGRRRRRRTTTTPAPSIDEDNEVYP